MKKSLKPILLFSVIFFTAISLMVLAYVGIKLECEVLIKDKVNAQERLETGLNTRIHYTAREQLLDSEERITAAAREELGMIKDTAGSLIIKVPAAEIQRIAGIIGVPND